MVSKRRLFVPAFFLYRAQTVDRATERALIFHFSFPAFVIYPLYVHLPKNRGERVVPDV